MTAPEKPDYDAWRRVELKARYPELNVDGLGPEGLTYYEDRMDFEAATALLDRLMKPPGPAPTPDPAPKRRRWWHRRAGESTSVTRRRQEQWAADTEAHLSVVKRYR